MALPRFIALKSSYNNKFLQVQPNGFLQFSGEDVLSPYANFAVEVAGSGHGSLVHIKCCYNNKYWVKIDSKWICAMANHPEEDQSKTSCTLFTPIYVDRDANTVHFSHVQSVCYVSVSKAASSSFASCLYAESGVVDPDSRDIFTIVDRESLLTMPKLVAFRGSNGKYLKVETSDYKPYMAFSSDEKNEDLVANEVITTPDGSIRIKSVLYNKFWRRAQEYDDWIVVDADDTTSKNNPDTLFWPFQVDDNVIALRNKGSNTFCGLYSRKNVAWFGVGRADVGTYAINKDVKLEMEELVLSRKIYDVKFRLQDARIYDQQDIVLSTGSATNNTDRPIDVDMKLSFIDSKSSVWKVNAFFKSDVKPAIESGIPRIGDSKEVILSDEKFVGELGWGEAKEWANTKKVTHKVIVPPMTTLTLKRIATTGTCEVPFSYSQRESLIIGKHTTSYMEDGMYTGINYYNFKYDIKEEKIGANISEINISCMSRIQ